jgi:hypothetical protein
LYDDPTNDLNPTDAVILVSVATTIQNADTNIFNSIPIPPTLVSGDFFVAALVTTPLTGVFFPAGLDLTSSAGTSWFARSDPGGLDPMNVAGTANDIDLRLELGNWLLRATATTGVVPEPTTLLLLSLGLVGLGFAKRRRP